MTKDQLITSLNERGIPFKLVGEDVRVMDMTQVPGEMRSSFDENGLFTEKVEKAGEPVMIEPGVVAQPAPEGEAALAGKVATHEGNTTPEGDSAFPHKAVEDGEEPDEEETEADKASSLRGPLPEGFPGKAALEAGGYGTYAKTRKLVARGEGWYKDVAGVGEATAGHIEEALKAGE